MRRSLLAMVGVALLGVGACGGQSSTNTNTTTGTLSQQTTLNLGLVGKLSGYWPFWVALEEGYFTAEKITVNITYVDTDARLTDALLANAVDMDAESPYVDYSANQNGGDLKMLASIQTLPYYRMIGRKGISSLSQLKGKKIAVSDTTTGADSFVIQYWLSQVGLNYSNGDYTLVNAGGLANRLAAVQSGAVDATALVPPYDLQAIAAGLPDLGQSTQYVKHFQWTGFTARASWLVGNKTLTVAFLRALIKGAKFLQDPTNKDRSMQDLITATGITAAQASTLYDVLPSVLTKDGSLDLAGFAPWATFLKANPSDVEKIIDTSYLKAAQSGG